MCGVAVHLLIQHNAYPWLHAHIYSVSALGKHSLLPFSPMATEAQAAAQAAKPIANLAYPDAEKALRARVPLESAFERTCQDQRYREVREFRTASWRDPSPRPGWSCSSTRARPCIGTRCEHAAPAESRPRKRRALHSSDFSACRHVPEKLFPTGPRDNGEVYWQCALCGIDL